MRAFLLAALLSVALGSSGCFMPACGPTTWSEPGILPWLESNGTAAGFERFLPSQGLPAGPKMAAAMPDGAVLTHVDHARSRGSHLLTLWIDPHNVTLSQNGERKAPAGEVAAFLRETLAEVHRGNATMQADLVERARAAWEAAPRVAGSSPSATVAADGPWDFDPAFSRGSRFTRDSVGSYLAYSGDDGLLGAGENWIFSASIGSWWRSGGDGYLVLDDLGHAEMGIGARSAAQAKEQVRSEVPGYAWTFQDFRFGGGCMGLA